MKNIFRRLAQQKTQYTLVCAAITLGLLVLGVFHFPNAVGRLVESVRDFFVSLAYSVCELLGIPHKITPTVNTNPDYSFLNVKRWLESLLHKPSAPSAPSAPSVPSVPLPSEWDTFKQKWSAYWQAFIDTENVQRYLLFLTTLLTVAAQLILLAIPIVIAVKKLFPLLYFKERKDETDVPLGEIEESKPLKAWHFVYFSILCPIGAWFSGLWTYSKQKKHLHGFWLLLALLYFNVGTILLEFCAYYIYFTADFDFISLYRQVYKLFLDLQAFCSFMPLIGWLVLAVAYVVNPYRIR